MAAPLLLLFAVVASDVWVYLDAERWARRFEPVVFEIGSVRLGTPTAWFVACFVVWLVAFPLYLVARSHVRD